MKSYSATCKANRTKLALNWYPTRGCWRKYWNEKNRYFAGDDSRPGYEQALSNFVTLKTRNKELEKQINKLSELPAMAVDGAGMARACNILKADAQAEKDNTKTLREVVHTFLDIKMSQAESGERSVGRWSSLDSHLTHLVEWREAPATMLGLTGETVEAFYQHLVAIKVGGEIGRTYAKNVFTSIKQFVRWAYATHELETLPRNLDNRDYVFSEDRARNHEKTTKQRWTDLEVKTVLSRSSDRTKLYCLLALNTGMTQKDISDLHPSEVNWQKGTITRTRSKTNRIEVTHTLWLLTFKLLKQEGKSKGDRVLTTAKGGELVQAAIVDDPRGGKKQSKSDNISSALERVCKQPGITDSFGTLRHTAATKLGEHSTYAKYAGHFLADSPTNIADSQYVTPSQEQFDKAVAWLAKQFGQGK